MDVCLLSPDLRRCRREVAVPVVETHDRSAEQREEAAASGIADLGHCRNGGEACHAIWSVLVDGRHDGRRDDLERFVPRYPAEPALSAGGLIGLACIGVFCDRSPRGNRVTGVRTLGLAPAVDKGAAAVGILHTYRAVEVPGVRDAALTSAGFIGWQPFFEFGIVGCL